MRETILQPKGLTRWAIIFIILISLYFLKGFFVPVLVALVIGFTTWPIYSLFISKEEKSSTFMASLAVLTIIFSFIIPISFFTYYAILEIQELTSSVILLNQKGIPAPHWLSLLPESEWLIKLWNMHIAKPQGLKITAENFLKEDGMIFIKETVSFVSIHLIEYILSIIFIVISLFFIYRDGIPISRQCDVLGKYVFPIYWDKLSIIIPKVVRSTFLGTTIIAIGEGLILGFAYWLAGIQSYVILGILTAIMATIPGGAPLSFTLVSIYLVLQGNFFNGICLLSWGTIELFIVDKTLRPFLVGGPIKLPFLPTFFGLVGGVRTMGLLGLFIGPVLMALITTIWKESVIAARNITSETESDDS